MRGHGDSGATQATGWQLVSPRILLRALALATALLFIIVAAHTPITIHADGSYDDGLFIALGKHLATGNWLGAYSQFTLMKGPGYPLFLAVNSWLGLPVGLAYALFQCAALAFFFWAFAQLSNMPNLAFWGFMFTLWAPAPYLDRITRDAIYPGELLLVLGTLCYALFAKLPKKSRIAWGSLCGLSAGWFALTREEGIWIVPGIAIIIFYALWISWRRHTLGRNTLAPLIAITLAFMSTQVAFSAINWIEYGKATGVETNSAPFKNALGALQSVKAGQRIPYVPVSRQARLAIYAVSPSFRSLRNYFDPIDAKSPWQYGCQFYPATCGDIAGGWFLWALREAVAEQGFYTSPTAAAKFYRKLATEVTQACDDHRLRCSTIVLPLLPHISYAEWRNLPVSLLSGIRQITFMQAPSLTVAASSGTPQQIESGLAFLGHPVITPVSQSSNIFRHYYQIHGWYRSPSHDWISGQLSQPGGHTLIISISRTESPDLVTAFKDPSATHERFHFYVACGTSCNLQFKSDNGSSISVNLTQQLVRHQYALGPGTLYIDAISPYGDGSSNSDIHVQTATTIRRFDIELYAIFMPWLAATAFFAMLAVIGIAIFKRRLDLMGAIATAIWALIVSRLLLLGIIDISSFPGMTIAYLAPAYVLTSLAVTLSFGALFTSIKTFRVYNE